MNSLFGKGRRPRVAGDSSQYAGMLRAEPAPSWYQRDGGFVVLRALAIAIPLPVAYIIAFLFFPLAVRWGLYACAGPAPEFILLALAFALFHLSLSGYLFLLLSARETDNLSVLVTWWVRASLVAMVVACVLVAAASVPYLVLTLAPFLLLLAMTSVAMLVGFERWTRGPRRNIEEDTASHRCPSVPGMTDEVTM